MYLRAFDYFLQRSQLSEVRNWYNYISNEGFERDEVEPLSCC